MLPLGLSEVYNMSFTWNEVVKSVGLPEVYNWSLIFTLKRGSKMNILMTTSLQRKKSCYKPMQTH